MKIINKIVIMITLLLMVGTAYGANPSSIYAIGGSGSTTIDISSEEFQTIDSINFNVTDDTNGSIQGTFNIEKISGIDMNEVYLRILLDDEEIYNKLIRSVNNIDDIGSVGFITTTELIENEHNLQIQVRRTGDGIVKMFNIDNVILFLSTNTGEIIDYTYNNYNYNFVGDGTYKNTYNSTHTNQYEGDVLYIDTYRITSTDATETISYSENYNTSNKSGYSLRDITTDGGTGSVSNSYIYTGLSADTYTYQKYDKSTTGTNTVTGELYIMPYNVTSTEYIPHQYISNESTDGNSYISFTSDTNNVLMSGDYDIQNGSAIVFIYSVSAYLQKKGTFNTWGELTNSTGDVVCTSKKQRTLERVSIGNVNIYSICDDLNVGDTYTFTVYYNATESGRIYDESLSYMEAVEFDITTELQPPLYSDIISPDNNENVCGSTDIEWLPFTDGSDITYNVTLRNVFGKFIKTIETGMNIDSTTYDFRENSNGYYRINIEGCNVDGCSDTDVKVYNSCYNEEEPQEQGIHLWVVIGLMIIIGFSAIMGIKYKMVSFGIFSGVLMIILAALLFNGIYWNVCESNGVDSHYCGIEYLDIPYWIQWSSQIMLILLAFGLILESIAANPLKTKDDSRGLDWYK